MTAPRPPKEAQRLQALRQFQIMDTDAEQAFDDIVLLASHICAAPISYVSFVDEKRQWFKAVKGLEARETPRDVAFCSHTVQGRELLVVKDARQDERFCNFPLVTRHPKVRFYAGAPLVTAGGESVGAVCVMDSAPRAMSDEQQAALRALSRQVMMLLDLRRAGIELFEALKENQALEALLPICAHCKSIRDPNGGWQNLEDYVLRRTGTRFSHSVCPACARENYSEFIKVPA